MSLARFTSIRDEPITAGLSLGGISSSAPGGGDSLSRSAHSAAGADQTGELSSLVDAQQSRRFNDEGGFSPRKPTTLKETGLGRAFVEELLCRFLLLHGSASGRRLAQASGPAVLSSKSFCAGSCSCTARLPDDDSRRPADLRSASSNRFSPT